MKPTKNKVVVYRPEEGVIVVRNEADGFDVIYWLFAPNVVGSLAFNSLEKALEYAEEARR